MTVTMEDAGTPPPPVPDSLPTAPLPPRLMPTFRPTQVFLALVAVVAVASLLWALSGLRWPFDAAASIPVGGDQGEPPAGSPPAGVLDAAGPRGGIRGRVLFAGRPELSPPGGGQMWDIVLFLRGRGLERELAEPQPDPAPGAILDQFDMTFTPHVVILQQGDSLELRNSDVTLHNMHAQTRINPPFNHSLSPQGRTPVTLPRHEFIRVVCNYHPQMSAWIAVLPNRFFTRADETGTFSLSGIPPGEYDLVGWRESSYPPYTPHLASKRLRIAPGETTQVELDFP